MKKILSLTLLVAMLLCSALAFASCSDADSAKVKVVDIPLSEEKYAFCVNKNDTELLEKTNAFLKEIQKNGKFNEICNNYFGENGTPLKFESAKLDASKDQLVVATSTGFAPFEMVEGNKYSGIDLEIAYYLAESLGKELVIMDMKFEAVVASVNGAVDEDGNGYTGQKCDIGMAGLTVTEKRAKAVTFTDSYYNASQVLMVKASDTTFDTCKTAEDVVKILNAQTGKKIGCQTGTTGEIYIKGDADDPDGYGFPGLPATKMAYDYAALAVTAMVQGSIDYVIVDNGPAKAIAAKING